MIERLELQDFGKFHNYSIDLAENLNFFYGKNEAGKSTIFHFILAILYGFSKDSKYRKIYDEYYDIYKPLEGFNYRGAMEISIDNTRYRVERNFLKERESCKVWNLKTRQVLEDREELYKFSRIPQPGVLFFNMDKESFLQLFALKDLSNFNRDNFLREQIYLAESFSRTKNLSVDPEKAMERLEEENKKIGSSRAKTSSLGRIMEDIRLCEEEAKNSLKTQMEYEKILNKYQDLKKEKNEIENKLKVLEPQNSHQRIYDIKSYHKKMAILNELKDQNMVLESKLQENEEKMDSYENLYPWLLEKRVRRYLGKMIFSGLLIALGIGLLILSLPMGDQIIFGLGLIVLFLGLLLFFIFNRKNIKDRMLEREYTGLFHQQDDLLIQKESLNKKFSLAMDRKEPDPLQLKDNLELSISEIQEDLNKIDRTNSNPLVIDLKNQLKDLDKDEARFTLLLDQLEEKKIYQQQLHKKRMGLQDKRDRLLEEKEAVEISIDILNRLLKRASTSFQDKFYKQANSYLEKFSERTYGNLSYEKDSGYYLYNRDQDYNVHQDILSRSSMEILYLSLRLSMMDMKDNREIPLLLDDAFVHFDNSRKKIVMDVLNSMGRQVLLFSKDPLGSEDSSRIIELNK